MNLKTKGRERTSPARSHSMSEGTKVNLPFVLDERTIVNKTGSWSFDCGRPCLQGQVNIQFLDNQELDHSLSDISKEAAKVLMI